MSASLRAPAKALGTLAVLVLVALTAGCIELFSLCLLPCAVCIDVADGSRSVAPVSTATQSAAVAEHAAEHAKHAAEHTVRY